MEFVQKIETFFESGVFQDFYQLFSLSMDATDEDIKKRYRDLCKIYHPDFPTGDEAMMKKVSKAYDILKDPMIRSIYNVYYVDYQMRRKETSNISKESTEITEPVTQDVSTESTKVQESVQPQTVNQSSNNSCSMNTNSSYMNSTKKKGSSYPFGVSPNTIRNTLRKHHYSEKTINDFLLWCQKCHMKITNGKELHSVFSKYLSLTKKDTEDVHSESQTSSNRENVHYNLKRENPYHRKKNAHQNSRKASYNNITSRFPFRELKACQTFVKNHYMSSIRNLQFFDFQSFVTLIHTIQNVTVFFNENRNYHKKRNVKVKHY